ncbi:MAG: hypothetical protein ACJAVI_004285 [Candidatus Azotimanducaceae bacterium]|jgi:hypothetical protein
MGHGVFERNHQGCKVCQNVFRVPKFCFLTVCGECFRIVKSVLFEVYLYG